MDETRSLADVTLWIDQAGRMLNGQTLIAIGVALLLGVGWRAKWHEKAFHALRHAMFENWQLSLLGATGLVLSLASGYTTWDGMSNFTCSRDLQASNGCFGAHVLSAMVTFGIQGVMLITAWLIGESFATGMNRRHTKSMSSANQVIAAFAAVLLMVAVGLWLTGSSSAVAGNENLFAGLSASKVAEYSVFGVIGLLVVALMVAMQDSDLAAPYLQSTRIVIKNFMLWVMFLACMSTSVFFSFDSLFSAIFPQDERVRAAELRAHNQVIGLTSDIKTAIDTRLRTAVDDLFRSDGWNKYDAQLSTLEKVAQGAQGQIEAYFNARLEDRNRSVREQQERISTAQSGQAGLASRKISLTDELSRLKADRPALAADYADKKTELDTRARNVDAKRVEAMAEDRGVEGTGKQGRGPVYRQRVDELQKLQDAYKIQEDRVKDAQKRIAATDTRIAQIERELAGIDGDLGKLKAEAQTAEQRIALAQQSLPSDQDARIDPARMLPAFQNARADFREHPDLEHLGALQGYCTQLYTALIGVEVTKGAVAHLDCDPKQASEAAAVVFALNTGKSAFAARCDGGDKVEANTTADALFGFAKKCLADSGLPSKDTEVLRNRINGIELARDDKAHRFVVTLNAFNDGNRLAYLALAIAMDSLVFMSGLFGANALRSPLSDVPTTKARSAAQLEAIIENALLPERFEAAHAVLDAMHPITPTPDGFTSEVLIPADETPGKRTVLKVLNAGATIGAVTRADHAPEGYLARYLVRQELFEFLSHVSKRAFETDKRHLNAAELEKLVSVALLPDIGGGAETVLSYMHPIQESPTLLEKLGLKGPHGFMAEIIFSEVADPDQRLVRSALNAGATVLAVQRGDQGHYFLTGDFYRVLARIRGRLLVGTSYAPQLPAPGPRAGGKLDADVPKLPAADKVEAKQIPAPAPKQADKAPTPQLLTHDQYVEHFLRALGISGGAYDRVMGPGGFSSATAVAQALPRDRLGFAEVEARALAALDAIEAQLAQNGDTRIRASVAAARQEIEQNLDQVLLARGGPFDVQLRAALSGLEQDHGDGAISPQDEQLLWSLRELVNHLDGKHYAANEEGRTIQ